MLPTHLLTAYPRIKESVHAAIKYEGGPLPPRLSLHPSCQTALRFLRGSAWHAYQSMLQHTELSSSSHGTRAFTTNRQNLPLSSNLNCGAFTGMGSSLQHCTNLAGMDACPNQCRAQEGQRSSSGVEQTTRSCKPHLTSGRRPWNSLRKPLKSQAGTGLQQVFRWRMRFIIL